MQFQYNAVKKENQNLLQTTVQKSGACMNFPFASLSLVHPGVLLLYLLIRVHQRLTGRFRVLQFPFKAELSATEYTLASKL